MRWLRLAFLPVSVVTLVSAALIVPLPRYVERPGQVLSLDDCVIVGEDNQAVTGDFLLTTVNVRQATLADFVRAAVQSDTKIEEPGTLVPHGMDSGSYFRQQRVKFRSSADLAAAIGLNAAGLSARISGRGAYVRAVAPNSPADEVLFPADVIVGVDDRRVRSARDLREAVVDGTEGQHLRLTVRRDGRTLTIDVAPVVLDGRLRIGVVPETFDRKITLPVDVEVRSGPIGGSSAGLMMALTVFDKASEEVDLAAGRIVAGTGDIDEEGHVAPIGGVDLKILAAQRQGAELFLAPRADAPAAKAALSDGSPLQIVVVDTFEQARQALLDTAPETPPASERAGTCPYGPPA